MLSQIHRALATWPAGEKVPETVFAFVTNDVPKRGAWGFARENKNVEEGESFWLMPHFEFWAWGSAGEGKGLGTMDDVLQRIDTVEASYIQDSTDSDTDSTSPRPSSWDHKTDQVIWRGTPWFNPLSYPRLRQHLLLATAAHPWSDVAALQRNSTAPGYTNALKIEDFCRYKYVMYTEGVTYSGRLGYHMACESVLISAPMTWVTHLGFLLRPVYAEDLMGGFGGLGGDEVEVKEREEIDMGYRPRTPPLLSTVAGYREANMIYVSPNFDDLEALIMFLEQHPEVGRTMARNLRQSSVKYLSGAAETCYWRALIREWSRAALPEGNWDEYGKGVRFEEWILAKITRS